MRNRAGIKLAVENGGQSGSGGALESGREFLFAHIREPPWRRPSLRWRGRSNVFAYAVYGRAEQSHICQTTCLLVAHLSNERLAARGASAGAACRSQAAQTRFASKTPKSSERFALSRSGYRRSKPHSWASSRAADFSRKISLTSLLLRRRLKRKKIGRRRMSIPRTSPFRGEA